MRIMIKGGVWKNTEDEILKAAVMKYGLNQWARISSLLVRKSAKQCKARWYEWLDPAIKKTEWTRVEDEKLLHLAKLLPTQWRTIAPVVGRTPAQCLERYEKLLDAAAAKDDQYDPADDPRRLRPGEIDPNPEAKPARPDPIDMDEDEKEMLSEARARLANTRGKKAKRKAREKQLEEARRLASLQKKRELQAAGIEMRERGWRRKGINYNNEVAFEHRPAMGFFDTGEEERKTKEVGQEFRPATLEEMEGRRRKDIEAALLRDDKAKDERRSATDQPGAVAQSLALNDASSARRRGGRMMLPAPQVSEEELAAIARGAGGPDLDEIAGAGGEATRRLLGDYDTPSRLATPMRTPRATGITGQDRLMLEAQNLARLQAGETPLKGGPGPELHDSDFSGITPRHTVATTPHPLATPGRDATSSTPGRTPAILPGATPAATPGARAIAGLSATPSIAGSTPSRTPMRHGDSSVARTPIRDALGLNDPDAYTGEGESKRQARARDAAMKGQLKAGLAGLPAPQYEYQIAMPEIEDEAPTDDVMEEDAADVAARKKAAAKAREEAALRKRSQVLQRGLPRPAAQTMTPDPLPANAADSAEALLVAEVDALLQHEAVAYPAKKRKRGQEGPTRPWEDFSEEQLGEAKLLLHEEAMIVRAAMDHTDTSVEEYSEALGAAARDFIFLAGTQRYSRSASATNTDRLQSLKAEYMAVKEEMAKGKGRANKLHVRLETLTGGLTRRADDLVTKLNQLANKALEAEVKLASFRKLERQEEPGVHGRLAAVKGRLQAQKDQEKVLQDRYKELQSIAADMGLSAPSL
ncbi:hypothetical protein WJX73_003873 [Symbiochloris irregularis]|uniref:Cell division cycle 5-like protein n=1 Tax=Symbiochloris irregularis TaxID=706552 RepID=A0AAW1PYJ9_9CHLO